MPPDVRKGFAFPAMVENILCGSAARFEAQPQRGEAFLTERRSLFAHLVGKAR